jgi:hypothetical protein
MLVGTESQKWQSTELRLRLAAGDLLDALATQTTPAQAVIDAWWMATLPIAITASPCSGGCAQGRLADPHNQNEINDLFQREQGGTA